MVVRVCFVLVAEEILSSSGGIGTRKNLCNWHNLEVIHGEYKWFPVELADGIVPFLCEVG